MGNFLIDFEQRRLLISNHPCFSSLTKAEIEELTHLAFEKEYLPQQLITVQNDLVDSIYLVADGRAEVAVELEEDQKQIPSAILAKGDAIGISYTGFFSEDGLRTATLTAITPVTVIGWGIETFHTFLELHPVLKISMLKTSELMLRMNFIKQVEPFEKLPAEEISRLAQTLEEIFVEAGTLLFHQGDIGENCYLICSGQVRISLTEEDGITKEIATLTSSMLFGESVLLTDTTRNATAQMVESGKLLVLKKEQLEKLMRFPSTTESMMILVVRHSRPIRKSGITSFHRQLEDGLLITILKDSERGQYYRLSTEGWLIWQEIDGRKNLEDLTIELYKKTRIFAPAATADTLFKLSDAGFINFPEVKEAPIEREPEQLSIRSRLTRLKNIRFATNKVDKPLTTSYNRCVFLLFTKCGQITIALLIFLGLLSFFICSKLALTTLISTHQLLLLLFSVFVANLASTLLHELAHGYATKSFDHTVNRAGIMIIWFGLGLVPFVDTSDMWLSDKRSRIIVSLAGPYCDLLIAGICSLFAGLFFQSETGLFFWLLALSLYYGVYKNLIPLIDNDGYDALKEEFNDFDLRTKAFQMMAKLNWKNWLDLSFYQQHKAETYYWLSCGFLFTIAMVFAFFFQYSLIKAFPDRLFGIPTLLLGSLFPLFVLVNFLLHVKRTKIT